MYSFHAKCTTAEKNRDAVFDNFKYSMLEFCQQKEETILASWISREKETPQLNGCQKQHRNMRLSYYFLLQQRQLTFMSLFMTLKAPQISESAKDNEKKNHFRDCPLAEGRGLGDTGENGSRLQLLVVMTGQFSPRLPHLPKCPYTTGMRPWNRMDRQLTTWTRFSYCADAPFSAER